MAKLVIFEDYANGESVFEDFDLTAHQILIGSGRDNELVLEAPDVDPTHASLELRQEQWVLQDLGGPGGTRVNGTEIAGPFQLHHGDLIELGPVKLKFEDNATPVEAAAGTVPATSAQPETEIRGRVWFAGVAGITLAVILLLVLLLVLADYLGFLEVFDLLPPWFG
ncbi:MAG: FHA domain-containing protein [Chloroflexota bacterium]